MHIVSARQMQELDRMTIQDIGIPGAVLMENAGRGTFEHIISHYPDIQRGGSVAILAGKGNNGGDGFVIGRYFFNAGIKVVVFLLSDADKVTGDAAINLHAYRQMGGRLREVRNEQEWKSAFNEIQRADLIVDAMLGTGLSSDVRGLFKRVIEDCNGTSVPIVAVDLPSGLDANTGNILGVAIKSELTCTFGFPKRGLLLFPGALRVGKLKIIDIGIPQSLLKKIHLDEYLLEKKDLQGKLHHREPDSHKGNYGHLLILAGSPGKTGAAVMAAQAAIRVGAGLVTLGIPSSLNTVVESKLTEVMSEPLPETEHGCLGLESWHRIKDLLSGKSAVAIGPGISARQETAQLVYKILEHINVPIVIDADGLNAIAKNPDILKKLHAPVVLTPHPGEMARLLGITSQIVQRDRIGNAKNFAKAYNVNVVLKGARTVIAEANGRVYLNPTGNPGMASGGMGDVLTGMIAGLMTQGFTPVFSSQLSVFLHGYIGDMIASQRGELGIIATDIVHEIPGVLKEFLA